MGDFKIRVGEIHGLLALVGNGYAGDDDIRIAVFERGEEAVPRLVFEFDFESAGFCHRIHQIDVETFNVAGGIQ